MFCLIAFFFIGPLALQLLPSVHVPSWVAPLKKVTVPVGAAPFVTPVTVAVSVTVSAGLAVVGLAWTVVPLLARVALVVSVTCEAAV